MPNTTSHLGLLQVSGADAKKLLQGQLTCNLEEITAAKSQLLGAHCNPQGRVLSFFRLTFLNDAYYLELPLPTLPLALAALKKYAVFYRVVLSDASDQLALVNPAAVQNANHWKRSQIEAGIPVIYPATSGKLLPQEINLPALNAVSFNKGCYTGQEIIARMHYRKQGKNHLYRARVLAPTLPIPGADIFAGSSDVAGTIVESCAQQDGSWQLLVVANQLQATQSLFLDLAKTEPLELLPLPYEENYVKKTPFSARANQFFSGRYTR